MKDRLSFARRLAALLALLPFLDGGLASAQGFKWWHSERFQQKLQLSQDQISRIDAVFQAYLPEARQYKQKLDTLERELSRLLDTADETAVMQQANRVEAARADLSKARTRMLVRIRKVLTPDQRVKFAALYEEWERDKKRRDRNNERESHHHDR